ncbi:MAG TPA: alpha/beta hydrolase [Rhodospirillaceae bacterium]|nr:alpha/beta hydrolase [Rhodospirillaceae bacterium]
MADTPASLACEHGLDLAYHHTPGSQPGVMFCTGFRSNMTGGKAISLGAHCRDRGQQFTRFDYRGHGASGGEFIESTIGDWLNDTISMLDSVTEGPQILVGSSLGGWIALLAARARPERVAAIVAIAPGVDMTRRALDKLTDEVKRDLSEKGVWMRPSEYEPEGYPITQKLLDEGANHLLLPGPIPFDGPVRILHGMEDDAVPWQLSLEISDALTSKDVEITFIKDGDHRLSGADDIKRLLATVSTITNRLTTL